MTTMTRRLVIAAGLVFAASSGALAHHGWSWAEADQIEVTGTIEAIYIGPPHPTLDVATEAGLWRIELGNPRQTARAGFVEGVASVGDEVTALGNRTTDPDRLLMKAVRVTVNGATYDIYPSRIPAGS
jgi:hypothetical protein